MSDPKTDFTSITPDECEQFAKYLFEAGRFLQLDEARQFVTQAFSSAGGAEAVAQARALLEEFNAFMEKDRTLRERFAALWNRQRALIDLKNKRAELEKVINATALSLGAVRLEAARIRGQMQSGFDSVHQELPTNLADRLSELRKFEALETYIAETVCPVQKQALDDIDQKISAAVNALGASAN
jgi:hypothetical protein